MRTSTLVIAMVVIGAWLSTGLSLAQPASMGDAIDPVDTAPGQGIRVTLGAGLGVAPDYEGSDSYEPVPLWNLSVGNLYHPKTYVQVLGPRLRSNFIPDDHWRLGVAGQFIRKRDDVHNDRVDDLESVDASAMLGIVGGYDFLAAPDQDLVLELEARQDVANDNGFLATIRGAYGGRLTPSLRMVAFVGSTWADDDYMSSYFGIDAAGAAASGLDQFNAMRVSRTSTSAAPSAIASLSVGVWQFSLPMPVCLATRPTARSSTISAMRTSSSAVP
jgi:MipA family protein